MDKINLYNINSELLTMLNNFYSLIETNYGELPNDWNIFLDRLNIDRKDKLLGIAKYLKEIDKFSNILWDEITRLEERNKICINYMEKLRKYIFDNIEKDETISDEIITIKAFNCNSIEVDDDSVIPSKYFKIEKTLKKGTVYVDIGKGISIDGLHMAKKKVLTIN